MKYKNKELILDNFRSVLSDFSIDVQDVVRGAILDGIDISDYIQSCKNNPYKLDQIRLAKKENLDKRYLSFDSGESIYRIRRAVNSGANWSSLLHLCNKGLSYTYVNKVVGWVEDGYSIGKLNFSILPEDMLDVFEFGLSKGFDMSIFNTGVSYSSEYVKNCLHMLSNGVSISMFLGGDWSIEVLKLLCTISTNIKLWNSITSAINSKTSVTILYWLIEIARMGVSVDTLANGYDVDRLSVIQKAVTIEVDYKSLYDLSLSIEDMNIMLSEMEIAKSKKISGRL